MGVKLLTAELACERAWQVYCMMNPSAKNREKLKADLDSYLSKMETVDSSDLTVDGLKYLKKLEQLEGKKFRRVVIAWRTNCAIARAVSRKTG
jgi:hypothetical protein